VSVSQDLPNTTFVAVARNALKMRFVPDFTSDRVDPELMKDPPF
jgi:hypothetical protein